MAQRPTRVIYWKGKFDGAPVTIDAASFDPVVHSDAPWPEHAAESADKPRRGKRADP